ncbi:UNVERIFIED_CONTAM: amino acid adenylation domain-containing protein [Acetivibrio alkalicellulosi]
MNTYRNISDSTTIDQLFTNISKVKEIPALIKVKDERIQANIIFNYKTGNIPYVKYINQKRFHVDDNVEVDFFYKDAYFNFQSKITEILEKTFSISIPSEVQVSFLRSKSRYLLPLKEKAHVLLDDDDKKYEIIDISTSGFSFYTDKHMFNINTIIRNICLLLGEGSTVYVDGEIRYVKQSDNSFRYGVSILSLEWSTRQQIFGYIFEKTNPEIKHLFQFYMEDIWKLYNRTKYVSKNLYIIDDKEYMKDIELLESFKDKPTISVNLIYQRNGKLLGLGSCLRIYRRTFLGYLPHVVPEAHLSPKAKTEIYIGLVENLLNHSYFENYVSYFKDNLIWYKNIFEKIGNIINDEELYQIQHVKLFSCNIENNNKKLISDIYTTELAQTSDFMEYCQKNLSSLESTCFDYDKNGFYLDEIKEIYSVLGMTCLRKLFCVKDKEGIIAYLVTETYSLKENQGKFLNTVKIYLNTHYENINVNELLISVVKEVSFLYKINNTNKFTIILHCPYDSNGFDDSILSISGLLYVGKAIKVLMNRQGIMEFSRLLTTNFETYTKYYPLTQPQKSIWFTEKFFSGTSIGNIIGSLRIKNKIDFSIVEKALNTIVEKNNALRLRFIEENGEPMQYVSPCEYFKVDVLDFRDCGVENYYNWDEKQSQIPFNLIDSPLFYFAIIRLPEFNLVYVKTHHLISDAWTTGLLGTQIVEVYNYHKNNISVLNTIKPSYLDFVESEEEYKYSQKFDKNKAFWNEKFSTIPKFTSFERQGISSGTKAKRHTYILTREVSLLLSNYCKEKKVSVFAMFISVVSLYYSKLLGVDDLVIGAPILNRSGAKEKEMMGMFVSSIPLRLYVDKDMDFFSYLLYVTKEINLCLKNQKYNYDMILEDFRTTHNISRGKLYDIVVSYQNAKYGNSIEDMDCQSRWHFNGNQADSLVIHIDDREDQGQFLINIDYIVDMFSKDDIDKLFNRLIMLLKDSIYSCDKNIGRFNIITKEELQEIAQMLNNFNSTYLEYPKEKTICQLFEEQVSLNPYCTALVMGDRSITYRTLNEKSNSLARYLKKLGVTPNSFIAIMDNPSIELVIGIMAILKAGGAYLPIDPQYPDDRISYLLDNCQVKFMLTKKDLHKEKIGKCDTIYLDDETIYNYDSSNVDIINSPKDLAYIIFTSGSTGKPKGVMIEHTNLTNQIFGLKEKLMITRDFNHILLAKITFDVSVQHIFTPLITGGKLYIPDGETLKDADKFWNYVYQNKISIINTVPAFLDTLLDNHNVSYDHTFNYIMVGGDVFKKKLHDKIKNTLKVQKIINIYGPTECTINATLYECPNKLNTDIIPIGKPLYNYSAIILDSSNTPVPVGAVGELCFEGDGIARGYLKDLELTNEKFTEGILNTESVLYKTGDLAKWLPDGNIEYIGRVDRQVKINGIRIELEEIENVLYSYKGVKEVLILDILDDVSRKKQLCAYLILNEKIDLSDLKKYLLNKLPSYMVPSYYVEMDKFPLNPNGKVDKNLLPLPNNQDCEESYQPPSNTTETKITDIIKMLLGVQKISTLVNLFDYGLDSIKMVTLVTTIKREFNVNISFEDVYNGPDITSLSQYILENEKENIMTENLIPLAKGKNNNKNVFLIHSGSGEISTYMELCFKLDKEFNYWGIKMYQLKGLTPENISVQELAKKYIEIVKKVQPQGPYYLFGWCIGGTIAFEMAAQLEKNGDEVKLLALVNTIPPVNWGQIEYFDIKSEIEFLDKYFNIKSSQIDLVKCKNMEEIWSLVAEYLETEKMDFTLKENLKDKIPLSVINAIPKFQQLKIREVINYLNVIRTLHNGRVRYFPEGKISTELNFFKSANENIVEDETIWTSYCWSNIITHIVNGEHVSIFYEPYSKEFAKILNSLLEVRR